MNAVTQCQSYIDAWSAHDLTGILSSFAPQGTYEDPATHGPLPIAGLRGYVEKLWQAFPDLSFDAIWIGGEKERVVAQWRMRGTNTGSMYGLPPTDRTVDLNGVDVFVVGPAGIESVTGFFDTALLPRQLGLQVNIQPTEVGPFRFGTSLRVDGDPEPTPAVVALTEIVARSDADVAQVRELTREIVTESLAVPEFLGFSGAVCGRRLTTLSQWSSLEAMRASMKQGSHEQAMRNFFNGEYAEGATTSLWTPLRVGPWWRRCECGLVNRLDSRIGECRCGKPLESVC